MEPLTPIYNHKTFADVFESSDVFSQEYLDADIEHTIDDSHCRSLFYLLYARFGNSPIVNRDVNQFKYKVWTLIYIYGAEWQKRFELQDKLRNLSDDELLKGGMGIMNHAFNPSVEPGTEKTEELDFVNEQNVSKSKRAPVDGYSLLSTALSSGFTNAFVERFRPLFKRFVRRDITWIYENED